MSTYKQMYDKAVKDKAIKQLTPEYMEFNKPGIKVIGAFVSKGVVESSAGGGEYFQYVFETDDGRVKFHMGRATDSDVGKKLVEGMIYSITFEGKEEISAGRRVNKFNVEEIGPSGEFVAPEANAGNSE